MLTIVACPVPCAGPRMPTAILSTHPLTSDRLQKVEALLPEAIAMQQEYCQHLHGSWQDALLHAMAR
jgi:predicted Zn-dependent protease